MLKTSWKVDELRAYTKVNILFDSKSCKSIIVESKNKNMESYISSSLWFLSYGFTSLHVNMWITGPTLWIHCSLGGYCHTGLPCKAALHQQSRWSLLSQRGGALQPGGWHCQSLDTGSVRDREPCWNQDRKKKRWWRENGGKIKLISGWSEFVCLCNTHSRVLLNTTCKILGSGNKDSGWEFQQSLPQTIKFILPVFYRIKHN